MELCAASNRKARFRSSIWFFWRCPSTSLKNWKVSSSRARQRLVCKTPKDSSESALMQVTVTLNIEDFHYVLGKLEDDADGIAFQYEKGFLVSGLQVSPFAMPLSPTVKRLILQPISRPSWIYCRLSSRWLGELIVGQTVAKAREKVGLGVAVGTPLLGRSQRNGSVGIRASY